MTLVPLLPQTFLFEMDIKRCVLLRHLDLRLMGQRLSVLRHSVLVSHQVA